MREDIDLCAILRATVDVAGIEHVVHRLDVDPIAKAVGEAADMLRREERFAFGAIEHENRG